MQHYDLETDLRHDPKAILARAGWHDAVCTDPLVVALESACYVVSAEDCDPVAAAIKAADTMPPLATDYERGAAAGMAFALAAR